MSFSAPKPPEPPNPQVVAQAQAAANQETALLQGRLANPVLETTPYGTLQNVIDPEGNITRTTSLTPQGQANLNLQRQLTGSAYQTGLEQAGRIRSGLSGDVSDVYGGLPDITGESAITTGAPQAVRSVAGGEFATGVSPTVFGIAPSARDIQTQVSAPTLGATPQVTEQFQSTLGSPTIDIPTAGGYGTLRTNVENAFYNRQKRMMDDRFASERRALEDRLAIQGIPAGSEAYNAAEKEFNRRSDEAYSNLAFQSVMQGGQEAERAFGMGMAGRQQQEQEAMARASLANQAVQGNLSQRLMSAEADRARANQMFGMNVSQAELANRANQQRFGQEMSSRQLQNEMGQAEFAQRMANAGLINQFGSEGFGQRMQLANLANESRARAIQERQAQLQASSAIRQQMIGERLQARNAPLNELAVLMGTAPGVQTGQFTGYTPTAVAPTDVVGAQALATNAAMQGWQGQTAYQQALMGGLLGAAGTAGGYGLLRGIK